jgi:hypothetical protein
MKPLAESTKRAIGRPRSNGTSMHIMERLKRWRISEMCAEYTDEYVELLGQILRGEPIHTYEDGKLKFTEWPELADRVDAGERLMNRAFGRPPQQVEIDQTTQALTKVIYQVQWLPPDPNDKSVVTVPEPD